MLFKKWLREPLLHFLLIGAALFLTYDLQNEPYVNDNNRIVISQGNIDRLISLWEKKKQRLPTQTELQGMIDQQVREEVMYREALSMGMDKNDAIIRKRLAQKIEFISSDIAAMAEPSDEELTKFLESHQNTFSRPAYLSFQHIYFSRDKRAAKTEPDALTFLHKLKQRKVTPNTNIDTHAAGDSFMMGKTYDDITQFQASRIFGQDFTTKLFELSSGNWQGPVNSAYGTHLILISNKVSTQTADLNTIRDKVLYEWQAEQRKIMNKVFYENLRQRYEIIIEHASKNTLNNDQSKADKFVSTKS